MKFELKPVADFYGKILVELGESNENIFVLEADLMKASGSRPFKEKFPDRHINVGVAEQNLIGVAAGLAAMDRIPFACTMSNFISQRACDQVAISVAYNKFNVKLIGCFAGLSQEKNGGTHISVMDISIMRCLPNMKVVIPADLRELAEVFNFAAYYNGPLYIRMQRFLPENIFSADYKFEIGKGYQIGNGDDITIIANGITSSIALEAMQALESEGIYGRFIHLPSVKPVDKELVLKCAAETGAIITVEDHSIYGGLGGLISEIISENNPVPVYRLGMNDMFGITANLDFQLNYFGLTVENIIERTKNIIKLKKT